MKSTWYNLKDCVCDFKNFFKFLKYMTNNICGHAETLYFFIFQNISRTKKNLKKTRHYFLSYTLYFSSTKNQMHWMSAWLEVRQKTVFPKKSWFLVSDKYSRQEIVVSCLLCS